MDASTVLPKRYHVPQCVEPRVRFRYDFGEVGGALVLRFPPHFKLYIDETNIALVRKMLYWWQDSRGDMA